MTKEEILSKVKHLRVNVRKGEKATYKALLLLLAIAKLQKGEHRLPYPETEETLKALFRLFAPPVKHHHEPRLPYWYLRSDGLWEVSKAESLPMQEKRNFPQMKALRSTFGYLVDDVRNELRSDNAFANQVVQALLDGYFPSIPHQELAERVGLTLPQVAEQQLVSQQQDLSFSTRVLRAYEHRCAVTGFGSALGGTYLVCEAAYIKPPVHQGPDAVTNGLALEPTVHRLFDLGAWTLTDDRRILVSQDFTGTDEALRRLRRHHGKPINTPLSSRDLPHLDFIRWHREPKLGGVFRQPALDL